MESVYISDVEFANIIETLDLLKQFRGKRVENKFEIVATEVLASKYDRNVTYLDFVNCSPLERKTLRNDYARIEKIIRDNSNRQRKLSFGLDADRPFLSSEKYKTLIVSSPHSADEEDDR